MKKDQTPQDLGALGKITPEICYAVDESWKDVEQRVETARRQVMDKEASPLLFFMELHVMDIPIVAAYTGFWKWQVKKHLNHSVFEKLSETKLEKYAKLFEVSIPELKTMKKNEA